MHPDDRPHVLLVAGPGRSGTSTITGVARRLGFHVPEPEVPANDTNPRGFNEPQWAVDTHERLLRSARITMHDPRPQAWHRAASVSARPATVTKLRDWIDAQLQASGGRSLVVKDPRLVWFLDAWTEAAHGAGAHSCTLTMVRPPAEVVASKRTYYNRLIDPRRHLASWLNTMIQGERLTRGLDRAFVHYDRLLDDWRTTTATAWAQLGIAPPAEGPGAEAVDAFIDRGLRRMHQELADLNPHPGLGQMLTTALSGLEALSTDPADTDAVRRFDELGDAYAAYCRQQRSLTPTAWAALAYRTAQQALGRV